MLSCGLSFKKCGGITSGFTRLRRGSHRFSLKAKELHPMAVTRKRHLEKKQEKTEKKRIIVTPRQVALQVQSFLRTTREKLLRYLGAAFSSS